MDVYTYRHPNGLGLGDHHSGPDVDLAARPAEPLGVSALRAAAVAMGATPDQLAHLDAFEARTMADLDMEDGTSVELLEVAGNGWHVVAWTDRHGDGRCTSISPDDFARYFTVEG